MNRYAMPKRGRFLSRSALAIALALGVAGGTVAVSTPAFAAKKKAEAPKIKPSKGFVAVAAPAQKAIDELAADDAAGIAQAKTLVEQSIGAIESPDDRYMAGSLAFNLANKAQDPAMQLRGLKLMLDSGMADPAIVPRFQTAAGQLSLQAGNHAEAARYLQGAIDGGMTDPGIRVLLGESYLGSNQTAQGLALFKQAISASKASGEIAPDAWYRRGLLASFNAKLAPQAADFASMLVRDHPEPKNIGVAATILREIEPLGSQETLDLMRLMARSNSYAEERDYIEHIQAADPRRLPGEVIDVINAGTASGKLNGSDAFVADAKKQASERVAGDRSSLDSYVRDAKSPSSKVITVMGAADALLNYGRSAEAEELYRMALGKPGVDADLANTRLGIAQFDQGKYAAAQQSFGNVTGKRSGIAGLWAAYAASKAAPAAAPATATASAE